MIEVAMPSDQGASVNVVPFADESNQILEALESHLMAQVSEMVHQYAWLFHPETVDLALHDIAQLARVCFWKKMHSIDIKYPKAYISKIVHNIVVDLARTYEAILPLPLDAHGELYQGHMIIVANESMQDPSQQLLREESEQTNIQQLVDFILRLPRRQREAMLCLLKPLIDEIYVFEQALVKALPAYHDIDIEKIGWPKDARQNRRLRSSLIIARKKLAKYLGKSVGDQDAITGKQAYDYKKQLLQAEQKRQSKERIEQLVESFKRESAQLPERYRIVLQLHYIEERSFSEIAEQLHAPKGTIKARVHRGVQLLRQLTLSPQSKRHGNQNGDPEVLCAMLAARSQELAEPYQTTVRLRYVEQQAYPEIARTLGVSVNTIKSRLSRARKLLQRA